MFAVGNGPAGFMVAELLIVLAGWICSVAFPIWLVKVLS